ncbi:MAG TPA: SDR family NAD(P)-dependent oxidoreductase [Leeuwenhoekiella sp.]|nr:SDR family NAD(P)-dependent oxidoreductase [Leeuwenhoekiella sp.]
MLTKIETVPESIFGVELAGKATKKEFDEINAQLEEFYQKYGEIKFLIRVESFEYENLAAMWADFKSGLNHFRAIEEAAVITDVSWVEEIVKPFDFVTPNLPVKTFKPGKMGKAIVWLQNTGRKKMKKINKHKPKVVVITGASGGVGRATAIEFAKEGAYILLVARGDAGLQGAKRDVEMHGGQAWIYKADVSVEEQVMAAADFAEEKIGDIDVWINNAMVSVFTRVMDMEPGEYKRVTEVTYLGQVYGTQAALKKMKPRDKGSIILIGSALAYRGIPLQSAYCGAKHAIQGFFESLRAELLHDQLNIDLSIIHLPAMNTTQFGWVKSNFSKKPKPMGPIYEPEVAARAILDLAKKPRRQRMVGIPTLKTVWGNKFIPGFLDRYMAKNGFDGQLTHEQVETDRQNNLWKPVEEDRGIHGEFDDAAAELSIYDQVEEHKKSIGAMALGFVGAIAVSYLFRNKK